MMEVLYHFPAMTMAEYKTMPIGKKALYNQFVRIHREEEAQLSGLKLTKKILSPS